MQTDLRKFTVRYMIKVAIGYILKNEMKSFRKVIVE